MTLNFVNVKLKPRDDFINVYEGDKKSPRRFTSKNPPHPSIIIKDHHIRIVTKGDFEMSFSESSKCLLSGILLWHPFGLIIGTSITFILFKSSY